MLPEGWAQRTVADICEMQNGHGFGPGDWGKDGWPIIRIQNLNGGQKFDFYSGPTEPRWVVETGQLLFAWAGTKGVSFGPTVWRGSRGVLNQHIFKVHAKSGIDREWLYWALRHVTDRIESNAHGFKATLVHVKKSDIDRQAVLVPDLPTQQRTAAVLQVWNEAISKAEQLLSASQRRNRSFKVAILSGTRRLALGQSSWTYVDFDEVFERVARKNTIGNSNVLTISGEHGLISQREFFNKSVASADLSGYTLLHRGEFAYNKSYSAGYPMGAIKPLMAYDSGVVSSLYLCFRLRSNVNASLDFFRHYFESGMLNEGIGGIAQEGARNHGLLNVGIGDFFKLRLHVPDPEQQRAIATIINAAELEEQLQVRRLAALRSERQALMQQLLTGKRRVRLPAAETAP
jgi:type I restriction enzyme S subunit